jgi:hypothetical protein
LILSLPEFLLAASPRRHLVSVHHTFEEGICYRLMLQVSILAGKVKDEVARVQEMQDNFDMVRTKISVMLLEARRFPMPAICAARYLARSQGPSSNPGMGQLSVVFNT